MIIDYKSLFIGFLLGILSFISVFFIFGDIQTELFFSNGEKNQNSNNEVSIEEIIENGVDITNVAIKGTGEVTR